MLSACGLVLLPAPLCSLVTPVPDTALVSPLAHSHFAVSRYFLIAINTACKAIEYPLYQKLAQVMLRHELNTMASSEEVLQLELGLLEALDWRLQPQLFLSAEDRAAAALDCS